MGQQEVLDFLGKHREEWFTAEQIIKCLRLSQNSVRGNLRRLRHSGMVCSRPTPKRAIEYKWKG